MQQVSEHKSTQKNICVMACSTGMKKMVLGFVEVPRFRGLRPVGGGPDWKKKRKKYISETRHHTRAFSNHPVHCVWCVQSCPEPTGLQRQCQNCSALVTLERRFPQWYSSHKNRLPSQTPKTEKSPQSSSHNLRIQIMLRRQREPLRMASEVLWDMLQLN